tara:strand:- start:256 stop:432 length:177 start_codon:yes stop_codon:yes gene_type:complete
LITGLGPKVFESVLAHLVFFWAPITCDKEIKDMAGDRNKKHKKNDTRLSLLLFLLVKA